MEGNRIGLLGELFAQFLRVGVVVPHTHRLVQARGHNQGLSDARVEASDVAGATGAGAMEGSAQWIKLCVQQTNHVSGAKMCCTD